MMPFAAATIRETSGVLVVRAPRAGDALGHALRGIFGVPCVPADMTAMLRRLEQIH